jgi:hypothetical protein
MKICGVDPGKTGGICFLINDDDIKIYYYDIPRAGEVASPEGVFNIFDLEKPNAIVIEEQHAFPGQGIVSNAKIVAEFHIILATAKLFKYINERNSNTQNYVADIRIVPARNWQRKIYDPSWDKDMKKERSILSFKNIFKTEIPTAGKRVKKPHLGYIDAALIAEWYRREVANG